MTRAVTAGLLLLAICAAVAALSLGNLALGALAVVSLFTAVATAAGPGRIVPQCARLIGRPARLQVWGSTPPQLGTADVVINRVWALGAGLHFHVTVAGSTTSTHVKVAQPRHWTCAADSLSIADAKYVQLAGATVAPVADHPAVQIFIQ